MRPAPEWPSVSVVVPVLDAAATLPDCIESLLALDYPRDRLEWIVVDNASTDATPRILARFADRVTVLRETRRGASAARNRGLAAATGDVVAFTDADCSVDPGWLRHLVPAALLPHVAVAGGRILARRPSTRIERFGEAIHDHRAAMSQSPPYAISMNWATRRALLEEVGGFDVSLLRCQDVDLAWRLGRRGRALVYVEKAIVFHRNESTLGGLLREGFVHGRGSLRMRRLHPGYLSLFPSRITPSRRLYRSLTACLAGEPDGFHRLVFDVGKVGGEWIDRMSP